MMKQFKCVSTLIVDFGGVLINLNLQQCIDNMRLLGVRDIENFLNNYHQQGFFMRFEKGEITAAEFRDEIRKLSPNSLTDEQIDAAWMSFLVDIPSEKLDILFELRKRFRIVMLSNTNSIHFPVASVANFNYAGRSIDDYFDDYYLSYKMGMAKPDKAIFELLVQSENVLPSQCLFLDDGPQNIEIASFLGFQTYQVDPAESLQFLLNTDTFVC